MRHVTWLAAGLALSFGAAACAPSQPNIADHDYRLRHPVKVGVKSAALVLEAPPPGEALSEGDYRRLVDFAVDYKARGTGPIDVAVEASGPEDARSRAFLGDVVSALLDEGIAPERLAPRLIIKPVSEPRTAMVMTSQHAVELPDCYGIPEDTSRKTANAPSSHFGCAVQRNMGAMVLNPQDLIRSQRTSPRDTTRAVDVIEKYRKGVKTQTAPPPKSEVTQ